MPSHEWLEDVYRDLLVYMENERFVYARRSLALALIDLMLELQAREEHTGDATARQNVVVFPLETNNRPRRP